VRALDIVNRTRLDDALIRDVAQRSLVVGESFVLFLDDGVNSVRADFARTKLEEYRQKGWKPLFGWERDATGETDTHACTVSRRIIGNQQLPRYVIEAINEYELLVYVDATWTRGPQMGLVLTLAHELRHAWQYFNAPLVLHAQTPLSWVMPPQLTPCELDAEKAAKRMLRQIYGDIGLRAYLDTELARCKPEHREVLQRLAVLDDTSDQKIEATTIALLEEHAAKIRKLQRENNFVMPGIPELSDALRGRSDVPLRP
jgi:hypothetical protein